MAESSLDMAPKGDDHGSWPKGIGVLVSEYSSTVGCNPMAKKSFITPMYDGTTLYM